MSTQPEPGVYCIYNRVLSESGHQLAMTYNGDNQPITVTPLDSMNTAQHWMIENYNENQFVIPRANPDLKANWEESVMYTRAGGHPCWTILQDKGYFIQDGRRTTFWSIDDADDGATVRALHNAIGEKQRWIFYKVTVD
ncbi:hypothetical protein FRC12_017610 [Ceratobasidium sp. 428]|nr:hypothetical protein FRC12_017610 [Ceratobasidium sp. 428]